MISLLRYLNRRGSAGQLIVSSKENFSYVYKGEVEPIFRFPMKRAILRVVRITDGVWNHG
jgi:hypothetical protein